MMIILWILLGALVGWGGGRILVLNRRGGVWGDVVAGALGSLSIALAITPQPEFPDEAFTVSVAGLAGALAATFVRRVYADRYRRAPA